MENIIYLYDLTIIYSIIIVLSVIFLLLEACFRFSRSNNIPSTTKKMYVLEIIFFAIPFFIVFYLIILNFFLISTLGELHETVTTIKITGSQWQWNYEISNLKFKTYSSIEPKFSITCKNIILVNDYNLNYLKYLNSTNEYLNIFNILKYGYTTQNIKNYSLLIKFKSEIIDSNINRLIDVTNALKIPILEQLKFIVTSNDVIHSYSVNDLALKLDAVPGRINAVEIFIKKPGINIGFCSELCGIGHYRMPIIVVCL